MQILLFDQDAAVRQALQQALTLEDIGVFPAANSEEALKAFGRQDFDAVLIDLNPGEGEGWESLERLISLRPDLPVIAMTARPEQHDSPPRNHRLRVLRKPVEVPVLIQALSELSQRAKNYQATGLSDETWSCKPAHQMRHRRNNE